MRQLEAIMSRRILRKKEVMHRTGLSASTLWRLEQNGEFVPRVKLSKNAVGWYEDQVDEWLERRETVNPVSPHTAVEN